MTTIAANDAFQITLWRAEFADPAMEQAYQKHMQEETARFLRVSLCIWAVLEVLFGLPDWTILGASEGFYVLSSFRIGHAILLLWLSWQLSKKPHWASLGWPVTIVAILGYPLYFIYPLYVPESGALGFAIILLLLLSMYVFIPNRVMLINLIALVGILAVVSAQMLQGANWLSVAVTIMFLLWPAVLGYAAAIRINTGSRRAYVLWQQSEQANQRLEVEIARGKELEAELQRQALTDPLTGLSNRRHYEMLFKREHERCRRHGSVMTLGMIDLDHFKRINDNYGHDVGDQVLKFVAEVMQRPLRHSDILGRFGGEEFILILPDTSLQQAEAIAERMRQALEDDGLIQGDALIKVTATFGLTQVRADDPELQDSVRRADEALYQGKRSGRNKVTLAEAA
ncbi:MAG: GGDEF domain-containing protein [Pseudohongiella sp.]|nr:GGDEF domain-containing protein [Pseudohongiella sp.]